MSKIHILLISFLFAACSAPPKEHPQTSSDTLVVSQGSDLLTLDPYFIIESPTVCIQRNIFDPLTDIDANLKLQPCLAENWEHDAQGAWTFRLRRGVTFQNGNPFDASDVVYSIRRALDWPSSRVKSEIRTIETVEAVGDLTVRVTTAQPDPILPLRLTSILMLDRETCEPAVAREGDDWLYAHANGTGPYQVQEWRKDQHCILKANERYWGGAPAVKRIKFIATAENAARLMLLQRGEIDILVNVPPRNLKTVEALSACRVERRPGLRLIYLGLDCGRDRSPAVPSSPPNPLHDKRVRRAIALGIDNRLIVEKIMGGNATPADQLEPEGVTGRIPGVTFERPNIERAKALLAEAGYPDGFTVRLDGPNDRYINDDQIETAVANQLARIGIKVEVNALPKAQYSGLRTKELLVFPERLVEHERRRRADVRASVAHAERSRNRWRRQSLDELLESGRGQAGRRGRGGVRPQGPRARPGAGRPHRDGRPAAHPAALSDGSLRHFDRIDWKPRRETQVRGIDVKWARP